MSRLTLCLAACAALALAVPAAVAAPPPQLPGAGQYFPPGTFQLIPLPGSKVPGAWVLNTETGQAWLCGPGAHNGKAHVTCLAASITKPQGAQ